MELINMTEMSVFEIKRFKVRESEMNLIEMKVESEMNLIDWSTNAKMKCNTKCLRYLK